MDELLPVVVSKLPDADARSWLGAVALAHEVALLPLADAPIDGSMHFLEIYTPGIDEPLVLLAEPQGPPNEVGLFPLRLRPTNDAQEAVLRSAKTTTGDYGDERTLVQPPKSMRDAFASESGTGDRISATSALSAHHTADLSRSEPPPPNADDALAGRTLAGGKYTILELLGSGGAGRVYKARHRELQKIVAVKVLHPSYQRDLDFCARFYGEALAASKLDHPNVLRILDFGQEPDGMLYIAMEFLAGRNLQAVIDDEGPQRLERIVDVMMQVCAALSIAHEQGVVHRDIKPENIVLVPGRDDDGRPIETVKVCDFGIAQRRTGGTRDATLIQTERQRVVSGTPQYMSPEQGRGEDLDERSDIYSCGVVLYELTTGRVPFEAEQPMLVLRQHFMDPPRPPSQLVPDVDPLLEVTILKALRKDPSERQQTARELRAELRELSKPVMVSRTPSMLPGTKGRREVLDVSALAPLGEAASGFAELVMALTDALSSRGTARAHESGLARMRLAQAADVTLNHRGEITLVTLRAGSAVELAVLSAVGEASELHALLPTTVLTRAGQLADVLSRRDIAALSLDDGVDDRELAQLIELLTGPELAADRLRAQLDARALTHVQVLFFSDRIGASRALPWHVDICASRLAYELRAVARAHGGDPETLKQLRAQLASEAVRALGRYQDTRALLTHSDLIELANATTRGAADFDLLAALIAALPRARAIQVAALALQEIQQRHTPLGLKRASSGQIPLGRAPHEILATLRARFLRNRSVEADAILRQMHQRGLVKVGELPPDLQKWIHAEQQTAQLIESADDTLSPLSDVTDLQRFTNEVATLERSMVMLAQRGQAAALWAAVSSLKSLAGVGAPAEGSREAIAAAALRSLEDPALLTPIAEGLLTGALDQREPSRAVLVHAGGAGAHALHTARSRTIDPGARPRFVGTVREIGAAAWPAVAAALEQMQTAEAGAFDPALAEDVLRAVPDVKDEHAGTVVARFVRQGGPAVCKAAVGALATLWGPRARPLLVGVLDNPDEGVRLAALGALRKVGGIDENVTARIDRIMTSPSGDDLRATAAAALADATPAARPVASAALRRALSPPIRGVLSRLRGTASPPQATLVALAIARALLALDGAAAHAAIEERAVVSDEPLRTSLHELLGA